MTAQSHIDAIGRVDDDEGPKPCPKCKKVTCECPPDGDAPPGVHV